MPNPITEGFRQQLNTDKVLVMVTPKKTAPPSVSLIYDDGTEDTFPVTLKPEEFMVAWGNFNRWFSRFREANTDNPWPEE